MTWFLIWNPEIAIPPLSYSIVSCRHLSSQKWLEVRYEGAALPWPGAHTYIPHDFGCSAVDIGWANIFASFVRMTQGKAIWDVWQKDQCTLSQKKCFSSQGNQLIFPVQGVNINEEKRTYFKSILLLLNSYFLGRWSWGKSQSITEAVLEFTTESGPASSSEQSPCRSLTSAGIRGLAHHTQLLKSKCEATTGRSPAATFHNSGIHMGGYFQIWNHVTFSSLVL